MNRSISLLAAGVLLFALGACNSSPNSSPDSSAAAPPPAAAAGDDKLSILEPASGATVSTPFTVKVKTSDALGTTQSGNKHIHIWFDGNQAKYQLSYTDTVQVTDVPAGAHKMTVSLRNANHSDAGPKVEIPLTVGAGGAPAPTKSDDNGRYPTY